MVKIFLAIWNLNRFLTDTRIVNILEIGVFSHFYFSIILTIKDEIYTNR